jgi:hypothetical protein
MWYWAMIDGENDGRFIAGGQLFPSGTPSQNYQEIARTCLLLKFSEKISEPVGHGLLKDVLFTEAPSNSVLKMA